MTAERVVGSLLLGVALLCAVALVFIPIGSAWAEPAEGASRETETYRLFSKNVEPTPKGEAADGDGGVKWKYVDEGLTGTDGTRGLRAMGPLVAGAIFLTFVALLLTALPRVRNTRAGGLVAAPAAALFVAGMVAMFLGTQQHAAEQVAPTGQFSFSLFAAGLVAACVLSLGFATGLGLARAGTRTQAADQDLAWDDIEAVERRLRCPDCSTLVAAPAGRVPICPNCDFGADYHGPAGQPVPGRAVAA